MNDVIFRSRADLDWIGGGSGGELMKMNLATANTLPKYKIFRPLKHYFK